MKRPIREHMTIIPHSIAPEQTIDEARKMMRENRVRHLPVIERGELIGIISQTDLQRLESVRGGEGEKTPVNFVMTRPPLKVGPDESLSQVVQLMAENSVGSVLVVDGHRVLGIYTAHDAVQTLALLLAEQDEAAGA